MISLYSYSFLIYCLFSIIAIKVSIRQDVTFDNKLFSKTYKVKYILLFHIIVECLRRPVNSIAKPSRRPSPIGSSLTVSSSREYTE